MIVLYIFRKKVSKILSYNEFKRKIILDISYYFDHGIDRARWIPGFHIEFLTSQARRPESFHRPVNALKSYL